MDYSQMMSLKVQADTALNCMLNGHSDQAATVIHSFDLEELDKFIDALDKLAVIADEEAIRRAEKRDIPPEEPRTRAKKRRPPFEEYTGE